jgi:hypothetical protein
MQVQFHAIVVCLPGTLWSRLIAIVIAFDCRHCLVFLGVID